MILQILTNISVLSSIWYLGVSVYFNDILITFKLYFMLINFYILIIILFYIIIIAT